MDFRKILKSRAESVNKFLQSSILEKDSPESTIYKAMRYSVMAGGKRLRPVLSLAVADILGMKHETIMPYACAVEMIHTYSLIHDDLPAMDDDDTRRGKPTNHKVFGEAMAILAGDSLLNFAFETMLEDVVNCKDPHFISGKLKAVQKIAQAAGVDGMIGGQVVDIESENKSISEKELLYMHNHKTGALIKVSVLLPAFINNADSETMNTLEIYSDNIGLAFQIRDDILDVEGDSEKLGKGTGSDQESGKSTFITFHGINESKKMLEQKTTKAIKALEVFGEKANFLKNLAQYLSVREN